MQYHVSMTKEFPGSYAALTCHGLLYLHAPIHIVCSTSLLPAITLARVASPPLSFSPLVLPSRYQPLLPCQALKESVQVYKDHCKMAKEFHKVKTEIALLEDRKKELIEELMEDEKASVEIARLEEEFRVLSEENRTLVKVHSQRLETLRVLIQKRQGSS
ncbi:MAP3K7 C-terminal-like protein isoform X1 [Brienomyrus brachyistius]|uniref:MAP3K7 C-terminal-like protein isoform X1 n=1 Tax=Brienomyrus brachyistius TaxID=42636 RepID=UPI0020B333B7|nr:MAP3K7 C-terminal-like protein isoform X1 [Brienomyrus brachyistius]